MRLKFRLPIFFALIAAVHFPPAMSAEYYLSPSGDDAGSGLNSNEPWRSVAKLTRMKFKPGDRILLQGGATFEGSIPFDAEDTGTADKPVVITSYGEGSATLKAGHGNGLAFHNTAGVSISNLIIVGSGVEANDSDGIVFFNDLPDDVKLGYIRIENVEISGFRRHGISIGGWRGQSGYKDIRISKCLTFDNGIAGIATFGRIIYAIEDIQISECKAYRNAGIPKTHFTSGHGIVLGGVDGGVIERCVAFENGRDCSFREGPAGIWAWSSRKITMEFNESYNNRTAGKTDGGGFALSYNVSDSRVQYNFSHGNDGPGFLLSHEPDSRGFTGNTLRFNISQNDARKNSFGGITVIGRVLETEIYNNTVFVSGAESGAAKAVYIHNDGVENRRAGSLNFRNNIFQTAGGARLLEVSARQIAEHANILFQGNAWFAADAKWQIQWGKSAFTSLADWRRETSQEMLEGAETGTSVDPALTNAGGAPTLDGVAGRTADAYHLQKTSPLINSGLNLSKLFKIDPGAHDFFKKSLTPDDGFDVGAHDFQP